MISRQGDEGSVGGERGDRPDDRRAPEEADARTNEVVARLAELARSIEFRRTVGRYLVRFGVVEHEVDDVVHEVLLSILERRRPVDREPDIRLFIAMARRRVVTISRLENAAKRGGSMERTTLDRTAREPAIVAEPSRPLETLETAAMLRCALRTLSTLDRMILEGWYLDGESAAQLGARFGLSAPVVRRRRSRAERSLRLALLARSGPRT